MVVINLKLPSGRLQVSTILKRSSSNTYITYNFIAGNEHTDITSLIPIECNIKFIVEETCIETDIEGTNFLPCHISIDSGRSSNCRHLIHISSNPADSLCRHCSDIWIPRLKSLVTDRTIRSSKFKCRNVRLDISPEVFF